MFVQNFVCGIVNVFILRATPSAAGPFYSCFLRKPCDNTSTQRSSIKVGVATSICSMLLVLCRSDKLIVFSYLLPVCFLRVENLF